MTERVEPSGGDMPAIHEDWRASARKIFGTDDLTVIRTQLGEQASSLTLLEQRIRRAILFRAIAHQAGERGDHDRPASRRIE